MAYNLNAPIRDHMPLRILIPWLWKPEIKEKNFRTWILETLSALLALCEGNLPVTDGCRHKSQWSGAWMFSLICAWIDGWLNNRDTSDLRRHRARYNVTEMSENFRHSGAVAGMFSYKDINHYSDVIMSAMASQITSLTIAYSTVYSGADHRKPGI